MAGYNPHGTTSALRPKRAGRRVWLWERNNEGRFAGFLAEACYFVELDGEAPEGVRKDISDGLVQVVIFIVRPFVDTALQEQFAVISQRLQHPVLRLQLGAPNLRIVGAGEDDFDLIYSLESEWMRICDL